MAGACCSIVSPTLLDYVARHGDAQDRAAVLRTVAATAALRAQRSLVGRVLAGPAPADARTLDLLPAPTGGRRSVYDVHHGGEADLPGALARGEGDEPVADVAVNEAYDTAGATYRFYLEVYGRDSIDDRGQELVSSVHYGTRFENALWNGAQMVYGDGGGQIFREGSLTAAIDIGAHEMTHGVTQHTAGLVYSRQPGALNEHFSDVFGSLVKQWVAGQAAQEADWLIGEGTLLAKWATPGSTTVALRSLAAPGTAWAGDDQPATMDGYRDLPDDNDPANDNGGVHVNSGIPNHAFYLVATALGGHAWERAGRVWYLALTQRLRPTAQFADAADATVAVAREAFADAPEVEAAVRDAWRTVGVL